MTAIIPLDWSVAAAAPETQEEEPISEMDMGDEDHIEAMEFLETLATTKPVLTSEKPTPATAAEEPTEKAASRNGTPASDDVAPTNKSDAMKFYDNGFLFLRDKQSTDGTRLFWRCNQKHHGCPARLHTLAATGQVLERHKGHNHSNLREIHMGAPSEKRTNRVLIKNLGYCSNKMHSATMHIFRQKCMSQIRFLDALRLDRPPRSTSQPPQGGEAVSSFGRVLRRRSPSFTPTEPTPTRNVAPKTPATNGTSSGSPGKFERSAPEGSRYQGTQRPRPAILGGRRSAPQSPQKEAHSKLEDALQRLRDQNNQKESPSSRSSANGYSHNGNSSAVVRNFSHPASRSSFAQNNGVKTSSNFVARPKAPPLMKSNGTEVKRQFNDTAALASEPPAKRIRVGADGQSGTSSPASMPRTPSADIKGHQTQSSTSATSTQNAHNDGMPSSLAIVKRFLNLSPVLRNVAEEIFKSVLDELEVATAHA